MGTAIDRMPVRSAQTIDSTFEAHYSIGELARQWKLGRETIRQLVKDEPGVLRIRMGRRKAMTRYSIPESVARRVHTRSSTQRRDNTYVDFGIRS